MPILDREVGFDDRSRAFPIRTLLAPQAARKPRSWTWRCSVCLDQGSEGACVGHAWAHEVAAFPVALIQDATSDLAFALYNDAKKRWDPFRGEDYSGTTVLAGAKATRARGYLKEYRWAFGIEDALAAISWYGPAVLGVNWYEGMWNTDAKGRINVTGKISGGHAILARGVSVTRQTVMLHNSWGSDWGRAGTAEISWTDLDRLLKEDGEVCVPVVR
jgi:hypothetical protein